MYIKSIDTEEKSSANSHHSPDFAQARYVPGFHGSKTNKELGIYQDRERVSMSRASVVWSHSRNRHGDDGEDISAEGSEFTAHG